VAAVRGSAEVRRRIDLARTAIPGSGAQFGDIGVADGTDFADARLSVDDWSATFHVGLQLRASERWSFGLRYLHTAHLDLTGSAVFDQVLTGLRLPAANPFGLPPGTPIDPLLAPQFESNGVLDGQRLTTELTLPNQLVGGARFLASPTTRLFVDYQWTGWSHFDRAVLQFETAPADTVFFDYDDASTVRFAVEYEPRDGGRRTRRHPPQHGRRAGRIGGSAAAGSHANVVRLRFRLSLRGAVRRRPRDRGSGPGGAARQVRPRTSRAQSASDLNVGRYSAHGVFSSLTLSYLLGGRL
jgi:hypothetical protein